MLEELTPVNMLKKEINRIQVTIENPCLFKLKKIPKGQYVLRVVHKCQIIFQHPRSLFFTYCISGVIKQDIKDILGVMDVSEKYGAFSYIGGGNVTDSYFVQKVVLNISQDIDELSIEIRTFSRKTIGFIDAFQIYNILIPENSLLADSLFFKSDGEIDFTSDKPHIDFDHLNLFSSKRFSLESSIPKSFLIENIAQGEYCLKISHNDKNVSDVRKSLIIAFDCAEFEDVDQKKQVLGLNKLSKQYGVFEYMGGGIEQSGRYVQDMYLNIKTSLKTLNISVYSLLKNISIEIDSLSFYDKNVINPVQNNDVKTLLIDNDAKNLALYIEEAIYRKNLDGIDILIYADITPNVIDGSSIWLTSIVNILSKKYNVLVVFKDNINNEKNVISNIVAKNYQYLEPKDLGLNKPLDNSSAVEILRELDKVLPSVKAVVTRGYDLALAIQEDDTFIGRKCIYLTDFYSVSDNGFVVPEHRMKTLKSVLLNSDYLLVQTNQIKDKLLELTGVSPEIVSLPPSLPGDLFDFLEKPELNLQTDAIHIGYAGKIQPRWGVEDLLVWSNECRMQGINIHLHIATGKIYSSNKQDGFVKRVNELLANPNVTLYSGLDRFGAMSLMREMDYVWCYRDELLENSTLEISTKLIEMAALGQPTICYPSTINKELLGDNYPYFIKNKEEFFHILSTSEESGFDFQDLANRTKTKHSFDEIVKNFNVVIPEQEAHDIANKKKILIAGHDLKFINPWLSHLKKSGYQVKVDSWEWGKAKDITRSKRLLGWADIIFCEWGLANAVWYSQNNVDKKPLYIRAHAQEVRDKARKFGQAINIDNVSKVIFVANHIREKAIELWKWPDEKTALIPNYLLSEKFYLRDQPLTYNLGMVGIIPQTKRFDRAIDLLEALVKDGKDAHLYIKGHRPEELPFMHAPGRKKELDYYDQLYKRLEENSALKERVHFEGWGNDVAEWYQKIDFILSPSDAESFHYALADGVMSGCIPVVWNWEFSDIIYPKDWIINSLDDALLKIDTFSKSDQLSLKNSSSFARQYLLDHYSNEKIFQDLLDLMCHEI